MPELRKRAADPLDELFSQMQAEKTASGAPSTAKSDPLDDLFSEMKAQKAASNLEKLGPPPGVPTFQPKVEEQPEIPGTVGKFIDKAGRNVTSYLLENAKLGIVPGGVLPPPPPAQGKDAATRQQAAKAAETYDLPLAPVSELVPEGPGIVKNAARGVAQAVEGLSSPKNLAIMGATGGLGALPAATVGAGGTLALAAAQDLLNVGLATYFAGAMAKGTIDAGSQAWKDYQAKDYDAVARDLGLGTVQGLMTWLGTKHTIETGKNIAGNWRVGIRKGTPAEPAAGSPAEPPPSAPAAEAAAPAAEPIAPESQIAQVGRDNAPAVAAARAAVAKAHPDAFDLGKTTSVENPYKEGTPQFAAFEAGREEAPAPAPLAAEPPNSQPLVAGVKPELTPQEPNNAQPAEAPPSAVDPLDALFAEMKQLEAPAPAAAPASAAPAAPAESAAAPEAVPNNTALTAPEPTKPLWEMSRDELDAAHAEAKSKDTDLVASLFGADGAKKYNAAQRTANSSTASHEKSSAAQQVIEDMEGSLTKEQQDQLFGVGETAPGPDQIKQYRDALGQLDFDSPEALGESLKWAVTKAGLNPDPSRMDAQQRVAYAQLRYGYQQAHERGWDPRAISQAAIVGAAARFKNVDDATTMLGHLKQPNTAKPEPAPAQPAKPEAPAEIKAAETPAAPEKHDYASTQVNLPEPVAKRIRAVSERIPDSALAEDGRETEPHVTLKYGLHTDDVAPVEKLLANEGPIVVKLGKASLFKNDDADVLKVDVDSPDLHRLNAKIATLPNTETHPTYQPHVTIAYLKAGQGAKYAGKPVPGVSGTTMTLDKVTFSDKNGKQVEVPLGGTATPAAETKPVPQPTQEKAAPQPEEKAEAAPVPEPKAAAPAEETQAQVERLRQENAALKAAKEAKAAKPAKAPSTSHPARLRESADRIEAAANEELSRDRKANTPKRAREAAGSIASAEGEAATARTMRNIADAIDAGTVKYLANVSTKAGVETLQQELYRATLARDRSEGLSSYEQDKRKGRRADEKDIAKAVIPMPGIHGNNARSLAEKLAGKKGYAEAAKWASRVAARGTDHYNHLQERDLDMARLAVKGAKEHGLTFEAKSLESGLQDYDRLQKLGIQTDADLRAALTELVDVKSAKKAPDPIKEAERAIVGQKVGTDFFPTPASLATRMAKAAGIEPGSTVLEPSAGNGNLADAAKAAGGKVDAVEVSPALRKILEAKGHELVGSDFTEHPTTKQYDAVMMNPPFSKRQDAEHIMRAWEMVKPGGKLVAIAGEGVFFGSDKAAVQFRGWLDGNGAKVEKLPEGTFKDAKDQSLLTQTGVNARLIVMEKPAAAKARSSEAGFASPELLGAHLINGGINKFEQWKAAMVERFGPSVERKLTPLYFQAKATAKAIWKDESGTIDYGALSKAFRESSIYAAGEWISSPIGSRMSRLGGGAGAGLHDLLARTKKLGEVEAGKATWKLLNSGLMKLDRTQWFNLLDVMEGRAGAKDAAVQRAHDTVRTVFDELANSAIGLGMKVKRAGRWLPFQAMKDWFPHTFPKVDELKRGGVRQDILDNIVRTGEAPNAGEATRLLDDYVQFMEGGNKAATVIDYLVHTGKALDDGDAYQYLLAHRDNINRHGSMEHSREMDLPFYDPNPQRVLPVAAASAARRLSEVAHLGQHDEMLFTEFAKIAKAGQGRNATKEADLAREWTDRVLGRVKEADDQLTKAVRFLTGIQVAKLGLSAIQNAGQMANTWLATDTATFWGVMANAAISKAKRADMRGLGTASGTTLDPILHEMHDYKADHSVLQKFNEKLLKYNSFTGVERWNRIIAAESGRRWSEKLHAQARRGDKQAAALLKELGVDPSKPKLTANDRLTAASNLVDMAQFRSRPEDFPAWASTTAGKLLWQFKGYAYNQARFIAKETIGELRAGRYGRGMRNLLILAVVFPMYGELVRGLKDFIMGREPKQFESLLGRWLDDVVAAGTLGLVSDVAQRASYGKLAEMAVGPGLSTVGDVLTSTAKVATGKPPSAEAKKLGKQHLPMGRVWVQRLADALGY